MNEEYAEVLNLLKTKMQEETSRHTFNFDNAVDIKKYMVAINDILKENGLEDKYTTWFDLKADRLYVFPIEQGG